MKLISQWLFLVLTGFFIAVLSGHGQAAKALGPNAQVKNTGIGIAVTPKNFPSFTTEDLDEAFRMTQEIGNHAVFIYRWQDFDVQTTKFMMEKSRTFGLVPIVGLVTQTGERKIGYEAFKALRRHFD